ncbi:MAG: 50S ribosomal protein L10 [Nitrospinales bacterium]
MPTAAKEETVKNLNQKFSKAKSAVLADYRGISAQELAALRRHMRDHAVDFFVTKNTLARRAAPNTPFEALTSSFNGSISILVSYEDVVAPAKALAEYAKTGPKKEPEIVCGLVESQKISAEEVKELSNLPPREVLVARLLATFQSPTTRFAGVFSGLLRKFVGTLDAIKEKKPDGKP